MERITEYRSFEIHVDIQRVHGDMYNVWFQLEGPISPPNVMAIGQRVKVFGGPFTERWSYLVAELAGRAAVDVILGPPA